MDLEPVTPITLEDASKLKYAFRPQSDMTAIESALLMQLFVKMVLNRSGTLPDWPAYVSTHNLWRHFSSPLGKVFRNGQYVDEEPPPPEPIPELVTVKDPAGRVMRMPKDMTLPEGYQVIIPASEEQQLAEADAGAVR